MTTRGGFTLLELLVAAAMAAILAAAVFVSLQVAFRARRTATEAAQTTLAAQLTMETIGRDLQTALPPTGILAGSFLAGVSREAGDSADEVISFYHAAGATQAAPGTGDVELVAYASTGDQEAKDLVRRVTRNLLSPMVPEPAEQAIGRNITGLTVRSFDGLTWWDVWDSTQQGDVLPVAVEVSFELALPRPTPGGATKQRFTRVFWLACGVATTLEEIQ